MHYTCDGVVTQMYLHTMQLIPKTYESSITRHTNLYKYRLLRQHIPSQWIRFVEIRSQSFWSFHAILSAFQMLLYVGCYAHIFSDSSISPKFHQPKLRNPVKVSSNSLDIEPASHLPPSGPDTTFPPYWDEFLRKVIEGREGPTYWHHRSDDRKESFAITADSREREHPMIYNTDNSLNAKRRELAAEQANSLMSDESDRRLDEARERQLDVKLYEIHEVNDCKRNSIAKKEARGARLYLRRE